MDAINETYICPLLENPETYKPDTVDLLKNVAARTYWLPTMENMIKKFVSKAKLLNPDYCFATEHAEKCYQEFRKLIEQLVKDPTILKPLSVRTLLEYHEDNLRAIGFQDPWLSQKQKESCQALKEFGSRITQIDSITNFEMKWTEIIKGVLAGNVFDWGSKAVSALLETDGEFGLSQAMEKIQVRPWFHDDLELWINRIKKSSYKKAVIFVDNAGADFILGILPFVRELLSEGTKVILSANSKPALNDITYDELNLYCCQSAQNCDILKNAIANGQLITLENGQKSPCLDLANIPLGLCKAMEDADLVILEGMGRTVHTNLYAKFKVDSLKLAVLKNEWLAESLGAPQFAVICDFEMAE